MRAQKIGGFFVQQVRRELTLARASNNTDTQTLRDRLALTFSFWAHFYFNYLFAPKFDTYLEQACDLTEAEEFRQALLELFELHYLSALMSFNFGGFSVRDIQQRHFSEMQYGYLSLANADGNSPSEIIDNTQYKMLYHDFSYSWSTHALFGPMNSYCCAQSLLFQVKRQLEKQ